MPDPYNSTLAATVGSDVFEDSLTLAGQRLAALRAVKLAQEHLRELRASSTKHLHVAETNVVNAMVAADKMGAYELVPEALRPALRVAS